jgi:ATP-dependent helicase/nuclease subunit A
LPRLFAFRRNLVLAASAGTGKTHSLVGVIVHLVVGASEMGSQNGELRAPMDPARIVATTFSRKAAAEIRTRLAVELEKLATSDESAKYRADLVQAFESSGESWSTEELANRARHALEGLGRAQIGTLHSFAATIAKSHALELGISPGFELVDEEEARAQTEEATLRVFSLRAEQDPESLRDLVRVTGSVEKLMQEVTQALAQLDEDGRAPEELSIDPSDAADIDAKFLALVGHAKALRGDEKCGEFAAAVVRAWENDDTRGLEGAVADLMSLPKRGHSDRAQEFFAFRDELPKAPNNAERGVQLVRMWRARPLFAKTAHAARELLVECDREIRRTRNRASSLGFADVLRAARDVLRDHPHVAAEMGSEIDALLVDEFQDTSRLQRELVQLLWEREPRNRRPGTIPSISSLRETGLFVVGDRKQSIYGFRGADVSVFADFCVGLAGDKARVALGMDGAGGNEEMFGASLADFVPLRENRRGADELLAFANEFSRICLVSSGSLPFEVNYVPATEDLLPPPERIRNPNPRPRTFWLRVPVAPNGRSTRLSEAFAIAHRIRTVMATGTPTVRGLAPSFRDLAVLSHTNDMLDATAYALAQAGVPYVVAGKGFYSAREVKDVMAMLALIVRRGDRLALLEVLRGPWGGLSDQGLIALTDPHAGLIDASDEEAWEHGARRALLPAIDRARVREVFEVVRRLRRNVDRIPPGTLLREGVRALHMEEAWIQLPRGVQRVANVRKLLALADKESHGALVLLERWTLASNRATNATEAATFSDEDDAVRLVTVHASKGLDFPIVFLPEVGAEGRRPSNPAILLEMGAGDRPNMITLRVADAQGFAHETPSHRRARELLRAKERAERSRLSYVAVTRASEAMFFVGDRKKPKEESEPFKASMAGLLTQLTESDELRARAQLDLEVADIAPTFDSPVAKSPALPVDAELKPLRPAWRSLPIATTTLQDFHHCARRFQLIHLLDLPEREVSPFAVQTGARDADAEETSGVPALDARSEGTLAHRILERVLPRYFGDGEVGKELGRLLELEGIPRGHETHARIASKVTRFLRGAYATRIAREGASIVREEPFVLQVEDAEGRALAVRGTIDLLVTWPDGSVDVIDYKRARGPSAEPYAFQLEVYALAAREMRGAGAEVRAGIVFLGGDASEPHWRTLGAAGETRERLAALGQKLVDARWTESFPRVPLPKCKSIQCGYVSLCYARVRPSQLGLFG